MYSNSWKWFADWPEEDLASDSEESLTPLDDSADSVTYDRGEYRDAGYWRLCLRPHDPQLMTSQGNDIWMSQKSDTRSSADSKEQDNRAGSATESRGDKKWRLTPSVLQVYNAMRGTKRAGKLNVGRDPLLEHVYNEEEGTGVQGTARQVGTGNSHFFLLDDLCTSCRVRMCANELS
jgi:hypothetical protein